jgi:hypothetical protein
MAKGASWSMKEFHQALRMKRQGMSCTDIAIALGKKVAAIEAKLKCCGKRPVNFPNPYPTEGSTDDLEAQSERDVAHHRDLTGVICGDPPIGYSALDRKRLRREASVAIRG